VRQRLGTVKLRVGRCPAVPLALLIWVVPGALAQAQPKTDVVTLANGDRVTGEITSLTRGRLEYKTDDIGTIYFEWDKVVTVQSNRQFDVVDSSGQRFLGSLSPGGSRSLIVTEATGPVSLAMGEVTTIYPIGRSLWTKLDGSVDFGFSYTRSSEILQLNLNASTVYRQPSAELRVALSGSMTQTSDEEGRDDRGTLQGSFYRYYRPTWFVAAGAGLETNESLGLKLRTQVALSVGPKLVNTNHAQLWVSAGLSVNHEQGSDVEPTDNLEAILSFRTSYYLYDRPKTNVDVSTQYYPGLSDWGRHRLQFDGGARREIWKDVFISANVFDTFDSRPPDPEADRNDVGVVLSFGLTY